jgi:hypothetical protein
MAKPQTKESIVVSALRARTNFGKLLQRVENEGRSLVIEKRGAPRAILSIRNREDWGVRSEEAVFFAGIGDVEKAVAMGAQSGNCF